MRNVYLELVDRRDASLYLNKAGNMFGYHMSAKIEYNKKNSDDTKDVMFTITSKKFSGDELEEIFHSIKDYVEWHKFLEVHPEASGVCWKNRNKVLEENNSSK